MKFFYRGIISFLIALGILLTSTLAPAYAGSLADLETSSTHAVSSLNVKGNHNSIAVSNHLRGEDYVQNKPNRFIDSMVGGAIETAGYAAGTMLVCYTADALATTVFPPAIALAPTCSFLPGLTTGAKGGQLAIKGIQALAK